MDFELFSWGKGPFGELGHRHSRNVQTPKKVPLFPLTASDKLNTLQESERTEESQRLLVRTERDNSSYENIPAWDLDSLMPGDRIEYELTLGSAENIVQVACSLSFTIGLTDVGNVYMWGSFQSINFESEIPVRILGFNHEKIVQVSCGSEFAAALSDEGNIFTWGTSSNQRTGNLYTTFAPRKLHFTTTFKQISCGMNFMTALSESGEVYGWGSNSQRQLGDGHFNKAPKLIPTEEPIKQIACGSGHILKLTQNGAIHVRGSETFGKLGIGDLGPGHTYHSHTLPDVINTVLMPPPREFAELMQSNDQPITGCATRIVSTGSSKAATKQNGSGLVKYRLSDLNSNETLPAVSLKFAFIAVGSSHSAAITEDGLLFTFGNNECGKLGIGHQEDAWYPTLVTGLRNKRVASCSCGWNHTAILTTDGELYMAGSNKFNQLGLRVEWSDQLLHDQYVPRKLEDPELAHRAIDYVACGEYHTICIAHDRYEIANDMLKLFLSTNELDVDKKLQLSGPNNCFADVVIFVPVENPPITGSSSFSTSDNSMQSTTDSSVMQLRAHAFILDARFPQFLPMIGHICEHSMQLKGTVDTHTDTAADNENKANAPIDESMLCYPVLACFLFYVYTGRLPLRNPTLQELTAKNYQRFPLAQRLSQHTILERLNKLAMLLNDDTLLKLTNEGLGMLQDTEIETQDKLTATLIEAFETVIQRNSVESHSVNHTTDEPKMNQQKRQQQQTNCRSRELFDVRFLIEDEGAELYANRAMLLARNSYFYQMFNSGLVEAEVGEAGGSGMPLNFVLDITVENSSAASFQSLLRYLYTERIDIQPENAVELLSLANRYNVKPLESLCATTIQQHVDEETVLAVLNISDMFNIFSLKQFCFDFIIVNYEQLRPSLNDDDVLSPELKKELHKRQEASKKSTVNHTQKSFSSEPKYKPSPSNGGGGCCIA